MSKESAKERLHNAARAVALETFLDYRQYVDAVYHHVKQATKPYSYMQFAEDLGFGTTNKMWLVVKGRRHLSPASAKQFADRLGLSGPWRKFFLALYDYSKERGSDTRAVLFEKMVEYRNRMSAADNPGFQQPTVSYHEYFSQWFYPVIREMMALPDFEADPEWIRSKLRFPIHLGELKRVLQMMVDLGFVKYDKRTKKYSRSAQTVKSTLQADQHTLILYQQKMMDIAKEALTRIEKKDREVSCITASIKRESFARFQKKLVALLDEFEAEDNPNEADAVYQLNVQLFPFTE